MSTRETTRVEDRPDDWHDLLEPSDIGSAWKDAREQRGLDTDRLYDEFGFRPEMVALLELDYGYEVSASELILLATAFDTTPGALLDEIYERAWQSVLSQRDPVPSHDH